MNIKAWLTAFRLRTLPLALASIGMGSLLAAANGFFNWLIFIFCALTTVLLQVLSNLANDYGDTVNGADGADREGPVRMVQSGQITLGSMRRAIAIFIILTLGSGVFLLYLSFGFQREAFLFFFVLGILAIFAALAYTAGRKPYGYIGLGDLSVLVFFGIIGVLGSYYLYSQQVNLYLLLPAISCGLFSVAVLNINNIRDIESDRKAGKYSIPVRVGRHKAILYHWALLTLGMIAALLYTFLFYESWTQLLFLITVPLLVVNGKAVKTKTTPGALDPYLKQMALSTLLFVILFGVGNLVA
ncbi:1,4-dihydroxy-2-naphthoate octaprenyltransferase [Fulvivirga imtechensis AK7]|uniref:1,4-dihydroxy-2-naphthoate octaprenyltransferase n=1 Tax=Fulvivirga imtechensis AK7 TaxID=1237149 RepID=L8JLY3_9BACT|nr:1,4-dihydroxy-2-naphthoate polyprenyltransferase [Fulvivirga imtechensis]ELR68539.1 1,4-dihydroxy-2-naphthoate octaprenyltransferase [Fulvivirga imtechensis AK7]